MISNAIDYGMRTGRTVPASFKSIGSLKVHDLDTFRDLLVEHGLSKPGTKNYIESLQRRLSLYEFKKVVGKKVFEWNHTLFKADGQDLHKIWSNNSNRRLHKLQDGRWSPDHDADNKTVVGLQKLLNFKDSKIRSLEDRLQRIEKMLGVQATDHTKSG